MDSHISTLDLDSEGKFVSDRKTLVFIPGRPHHPSPFIYLCRRSSKALAINQTANNVSRYLARRSFHVNHIVLSTGLSEDRRGRRVRTKGANHNPGPPGRQDTGPRVIDT